MAAPIDSVRTAPAHRPCPDWLSSMLNCGNSEALTAPPARADQAGHSSAVTPPTVIGSATTLAMRLRRGTACCASPPVT